MASRGVVVRSIQISANELNFFARRRAHAASPRARSIARDARVSRAFVRVARDA
jgi:hypothetical protein